MSREQDELELSSGLREATAGLGERFGGCPEPALLLAAEEGVLPAGIGAGVIRHLENCSLCKVMVRDLDDVAAPLLQSERIRIWNRIESPGTPDRAAPAVGGRSAGFLAPLFRRWTIAVGATVVLVTGIAILVEHNLRRGAGSHEQAVAERVPEVASEQAPNPATPPQPVLPESAAFRLEKAPVIIPAAAVMVWRGESAGEDSQIAELKEALAPYRTDKYAEAERRLQKLAGKYPRLAEARFYQGVSQLFLNRNQDAVESLKTARRLAQNPLVREVDWYLAIGYHRVGLDTEARPLVERLCQSGGKDSARACAARTELSG
jgi:hypothetical protein